MMWPLAFIAEADFVEHVKATILQYGEKLKPYNLQKFNNNLVDPIKLVFDKTVYRLTWEDMVKNEIFRQRDKANNNDIGYFHQKIFRYITACQVPEKGWDVVFTKEAGIVLPGGDKVRTVYVEMKNKHNTMNSSASGKTYIKMQSQLLEDDDCACFLVEAIAKRSQNSTWQITVDGTKRSHRRIRRVSMDAFYALVTWQADAFYQLCMILPSVIEKAVADMGAAAIPHDTVMDELNAVAQEKSGSFLLALYLLGFKDYIGFG